MNASKIFPVFVRRRIFAFLLVLAVSAASHAQNGGNVGIYTREVSVFNAQATSASSATFPDFGFGANYLTYCNTGFVGTINLEWSPPITGSATLGPYVTLAQASYPTLFPDSACHTLQVGGYYPNLRSTVTRSAGSLSAWYTAQATGIPNVTAGIGSNGPSSPITCDRSIPLLVPSGAALELVDPILTNDTVIFCVVTWGFSAATTAGNIQLGSSAIGSHCASAYILFNSSTTASTPQTLVFPGQLRAPLNQAICAINLSGADAYLNISYASVHGL